MLFTVALCFKIHGILLSNGKRNKHDHDQDLLYVHDFSPGHSIFLENVKILDHEPCWFEREEGVVVVQTLWSTSGQCEYHAV